MKRLAFAIVLTLMALKMDAVGPSGQYQWSVALTGFVSAETGKAPTAFLWIPDGCRRVKAVMLAQQNMTEEAIFRSPTMKKRLSELGVGLVWVAPWFSQSWEPSSGCQATFEEMMSALAGQSAHEEIATCPVIPFGHSAQATFPWNFAAWNNDRTLCIISFHGDAPRTNLCGYGTANVEWGRTRNIDGIPGLMVEGEFEWWEARVRPALAFRMMYPESCISFLCDTGRGHFDGGGERTAEYLALFIRKAIEQRLGDDGKLRRLNPRDGWLASRFIADLPQNDGSKREETFADEMRAREAQGKNSPLSSDNSPITPINSSEAQGKDSPLSSDNSPITPVYSSEAQGKDSPLSSDNSPITPVNSLPYPKPAPYTAYAGDRHDAFWYFDEQMANLTMERYAETYGRQTQTVSVEQDGKTLDADGNPLRVEFKPESDGKTFHLRAVYTSRRHGSKKPHIEVICGGVEKVNETTFRRTLYEAGSDNPRRSFDCWLCVVAEPDGDFKGAVQPINIHFNH